MITLIKKGIALFLATSILFVSCSDTNVISSNQTSSARGTKIDCNNPYTNTGKKIINTGKIIEEDLDLLALNNLTGKTIEDYATLHGIDLGSLSGKFILGKVGELYNMTSTELTDDILKNDKLSPFAQDILQQLTSPNADICALLDLTLANTEISLEEKNMLLAALATAESFANQYGKTNWGMGAYVTISWGVAFYLILGQTGVGFIMGALLGFMSWVTGAK